ncbi:hypothetical protein MHH28_30855 [Paenibacillus sp. FSL K6-1217]|uniref:hypothetical protein n=1 Tax=Paenibacillus sp. FSL K6-1217 TaxID=2921466 RepID=UPI00324597D2
MGIWLLKISGEVTTVLAILLRTLGIGLAAIVYLIMLLRRSPLTPKPTSPGNAD